MVALFFKIYIVIILFSIGASLLAGGFFLVKDADPKSKRLLTSLTVRVSLSVLLFISLFAGFKFGWIQPHTSGF